MHAFAQALSFAAVTGVIIAAITIALTDAFAKQQLEMETPQSLEQNTEQKRRAETDSQFDNLLPLLEKKSQSATLLSMGFKAEDIKCGLANTDGIEQALDFLISKTSNDSIMIHDKNLTMEEKLSLKISKSKSKKDAPLKHLPSLVASSFDPTDPNNWPELLRPSNLTNCSKTNMLFNSLTTNVTDHKRHSEDERITEILRPVSLVNDDKIRDLQKTVSLIEDSQEALPLIPGLKLLNGDLEEIDLMNTENFCACGCGIYDVEESESQNLENSNSPLQMTETNIIQARNAAPEFSSEFELKTGLKTCKIVLPLSKQYDVAVFPSPDKLNLTAINDYENSINEFYEAALSMEQNLKLANGALKKLQLATADCKFNDILYPENRNIHDISKSVDFEFDFPKFTTCSSDSVFSTKPLVMTPYSTRSPSNLKIEQLSANEMNLILSEMYVKDEIESESLKNERNFDTGLPENCVDMLSNTDLQCANILETLSSEVQDLNDDCELVLSYVPSPTFLKSRPVKTIAWGCDEDMRSYPLKYTFSSTTKVLVNYNGQCDPITSSVSEIVNLIDIEADAMAANAIKEAVNSINYENEAVKNAVNAINVAVNSINDENEAAANAINEAVYSINYENDADSINETVRSIIDTIINNSVLDGKNETDATNPVSKFHYLDDYESVLLPAIKSKSNIFEYDKESNEFATKFEEISLNTEFDLPILTIEDDLIRDDASLISCMSELNDDWVVLD